MPERFPTSTPRRAPPPPSARTLRGRLRRVSPRPSRMRPASTSMSPDEVAVRRRIRADLDDRRDRRADHRAASGREQDHMRAARDQFADFRVVADVGKAEARFAVGHDVEQVQAAGRRNIARFDDADNRRRPALRIRAERLFFLRGEAAVRVADGKTAVSENRVVARRLRHARDDFIAEFRPRRACFHMEFAAHQFAGFLEDAGRARVDQMHRTRGRRRGSP